MDATSARGFWDPRDCARILRAAAEPVGLDHDFEPLDLSPLSCGKDILLTPAGVQPVLLREDCRSLQIAVSNASVLRPLRLYVEATVPPRHLKFQVAALQFLNDINGCGRLGICLPSAGTPRRASAYRAPGFAWLACRSIPGDRHCPVRETACRRRLVASGQPSSRSGASRYPNVAAS